MMRFAVHAADGSSRESEGTNIVPPFAAGTTITGFSINDHRFNASQPVLADGEPMTIQLDTIRRALAGGVPRTVQKRPAFTPRGQPPSDAA